MHFSSDNDIVTLLINLHIGKKFYRKLSILIFKTIEVPFSHIKYSDSRSQAGGRIRWRISLKIHRNSKTLTPPPRR